MPNDALLRAIGDYFLTFAAVETVLSGSLVRIILHPNKQSDDAALIALHGTKTSVLLKQIQMIARERIPEPHKSLIIDKCGKIRDCFDLRNDLAHHFSNDGPDDDKITICPIRVNNKGERAEPKILHTQQISEAANRVSQHVTDLENLLDLAGISQPPKS